MQKAQRTPTLAVAIMAALSLTACYGQQNNSSPTQAADPTPNNMKTVLIVGIDPATIDFSSAEMPKGVTKEMIEQGIRETLAELDSLGYGAEAFWIATGAEEFSDLAQQLKEKRYAGVVIGNGIRSLPSSFLLFERLINVVHSNAPDAKIIFNTLPTNTSEAVKRWL